MNRFNSDVAPNTAVCLFETLEDEYNLDQCVQLSSDVDQIDIKVGYLLNDKNTEISFIAFLQDGATLFNYGTSLRDITFVQGENTDIIDENGQCTDPNALTVTLDGNTNCICDGGYVSSNGGKVQGELDTCVSCVSSPFCFFEGDPCSANDDCDNEICDSGICRTTVSLSTCTILMFFLSSSTNSLFLSDLGHRAPSVSTKRRHCDRDGWSEQFFCDYIRKHRRHTY